MLRDRRGISEPHPDFPLPYAGASGVCYVIRSVGLLISGVVGAILQGSSPTVLAVQHLRHDGRQLGA
jgi:hypothetical protein